MNRYNPSSAAAGAVAGLAKQAAADRHAGETGTPAGQRPQRQAKPSTAGVCVHIARLAVDQTDVARP